MGCGFSPTAQSGRAGKGCFEEVDVNVCFEEDELADDDWASNDMITYSMQKTSEDLQRYLLSRPRVSCFQ